MAKEFKVGDMYYLPVRVREIMDDTYTYPVRFEFENGNGCMDGRNAVKSNPNLLLTTEEIAGPFKTKADAMTVTADSLHKENDELRAKLAEFKETVGKQSDKLRELQARIVELNEVNSSLGENRDALNNEAAVHMTSIHNLQVAVEVLAEKIFEMRCEQDG